MANSEPWPTELRLNPAHDILTVAFDNGERFALRAEYLRVESPSAEVRGHGAGPKTIVRGKADVKISGLEPVGNYGVKPTFSDGHDSGIFSWTYLYHLASQQDQLWTDYQRRLSEAGVDRDAPMPIASGGACGHH